MINHRNISFEKETQQINEEVQKKIANHLWIFCGYNDSIYPAISVDAKYIKAIFDLYNVIIDSSLITHLSYIAPNDNNWEFLKDIEEIRKTINELRTVGGHTVSLENIRQDYIRDFKIWEMEQCGTDEPAEEQDFEKLLDGLLKLKNDCLNIVNRFLSDAAKITGNKKDKLIRRWEDKIIEYYLKATNKNMFENKLDEWYRFSHPSESISDNVALYNAVCNWIMEEYYLKDQKELNNLKELKIKYGAFINSDQIEKFDCRIQALEESVKSRKMEVAEFAKKEDLTSKDYRKHYLSKEVMSKKIHDAIPEIVEENLTLLPQDLFGYIIKKDLNY